MLCGGATELVVKGFETLVEAGYQPEVAYYECLHELKLIVDLLHEGGLTKMHQFISDTAKYGDLTRGPRIIDTHAKQRDGQVLKEIQDGKFAQAVDRGEPRPAKPNYKRLMQADLDARHRESRPRAARPHAAGCKSEIGPRVGASRLRDGSGFR